MRLMRSLAFQSDPDSCMSISQCIWARPDSAARWFPAPCAVGWDTTRGRTLLSAYSLVCLKTSTTTSLYCFPDGRAVGCARTDSAYTASLCCLQPRRCTKTRKTAVLSLSWPPLLSAALFGHLAIRIEAYPLLQVHDPTHPLTRRLLSCAGSLFSFEVPKILPTSTNGEPDRVDLELPGLWPRPDVLPTTDLLDEHCF